MKIKIIGTLLLASASTVALAALPQPGLWIVDVENNGQPGRGIQLDIQGSTVVLTYYGYRADGSSTFYLGNGPINPGSGFSFDMYDHVGGKALGGENRSGSVIGPVGKVNATFESESTGVITLPGEGPLRISRFTFYDVSSALTGRRFEGETFGIGNFGTDSSSYAVTASGGNFRLERTAFFSGTCIYTGTYSPTGASLRSTGSYRCADFTEGSYIAEGITIDSNGLYRATFTRNSNTGFVAREYQVGKR